MSGNETLDTEDYAYYLVDGHLVQGRSKPDRRPPLRLDVDRKIKKTVEDLHKELNTRDELILEGLESEEKQRKAGLRKLTRDAEITSQHLIRAEKHFSEKIDDIESRCEANQRQLKTIERHLDAANLRSVEVEEVVMSTSSTAAQSLVEARNASENAERSAQESVSTTFAS
ncbi:hypothetical protein MD484_g8311, partial [Candolleomyces efflorescens]